MPSASTTAQEVAEFARIPKQASRNSGEFRYFLRCSIRTGGEITSRFRSVLLVPKLLFGNAAGETPVSPGRAKPEFRGGAFPNRSLGTRRSGKYETACRLRLSRWDRQAASGNVSRHHFIDRVAIRAPSTGRASVFPGPFSRPFPWRRRA